MQLSILPKNIVDTQVVEFQTLKELCDLIVNNDYSSIVFKDNYRKQENFISCEMIALDFDNYPDEPKLSLVDAIKTFSDYKCIISTSRNHQRVKDDKPKADRFRVILFTREPITKLQDYLTTWLDVAKRFPATDQKCKDGARFFYASQEVRFSNEHGKLIEVVHCVETPNTSHMVKTYAEGERGELSYNTMKFLKNGAPSGSWNHTLYLAARDFNEQLFTFDECVDELTKIDGYLDGSSMTTIKSAYSKPSKYPPRIRQKEMPAVEVWARDWLRENNVTLSYKDGDLTFNGMNKNIKYITSRMVLDAKYWAEQNPIIDAKGNKKQRIPYGQDAIEHCYTIWEEEQRRAIISEIRTLLEFNPSAAPNDSVEKWLRAVTGKCDKLDLAVFRHFIWQVKRKLNNMRVEWHIMPIFYGPSGSGKSRAIEKLFTIVDEVVNAPDSLTVLEDSRNAHIFGKFFIIFFDEMSKAEKVNVESLKNKITSTTVSYRLLGTNSTVVETNTATFIGASNKSVLDLIYDPTSARRFWQITSLEKCDATVINSVDYLALWQSVDEAAETPITPYLEEILEFQRNELRVKSPVEQWLEEYRQKTGPKAVNDSAPNADTTWLSSAHLFEDFGIWCEEQNIKNFISMTRFGRELVELGVRKSRRENGSFYEITPTVSAEAKVIPFTKK